MSDKNTFKKSQIGAVGSNALATNNHFQQNISTSFDFEKLNVELETLREELAKKAQTAKHHQAVGKIAEAEIAAKEKNGNKMIESLKGAGKWALDNAKEIGVDIVSELIKKQMEL